MVLQCVASLGMAGVDVAFSSMERDGTGLGESVSERDVARRYPEWVTVLLML